MAGSGMFCFCWLFYDLGNDTFGALCAPCSGMASHKCWALECRAVGLLPSKAGTKSQLHSERVANALMGKLFVPLLH